MITTDMKTRTADAKRVALIEEIQARYADIIADNIKNTEIYDGRKLIRATRGTNQTNYIFEQMDSVSAIIKYAGNKYIGDNKSTAVLNFANFTTPGGGFIYGAMAQEEALCMESTLYPVISDELFEGYYADNRRALPIVGSLYSNRALYSPDIAFFRRSDEKTCDVITCAAPNASQYLAAGGSQKLNGNALLDRLTFILDIAAKKGVKTLILGAYGCGVFGQDPVTLGCLYNHLLLEKFGGVFERVVFAVIDEKTLRKLTCGFSLDKNA